MTKRKDSIVWEDPPMIRGHHNKYAGTWVRKLEPLMQHPKRWARIATGTRSQMGLLASNLSIGRRQRPLGRWEFKSRMVDGDDESAVFARYLGPEDAAS